MVLTVHDELNFECPKDELEYMRALVGEEMTNAWNLRVPLEIGMQEGNNWKEIH